MVLFLWIFYEDLFFHPINPFTKAGPRLGGNFKDRHVKMDLIDAFQYHAPVIVGILGSGGAIGSARV